tara:strand:- start:4660 stop:5076 length:417 start_codon:yes stop_codon:yes gene_type:complete
MMGSGLKGFWLIYDGECPLCRSAAHAFAIREEYGAINLVDARSAPDHPACLWACAEGLDLDEGMVIFANGGIYHGAGAVSFLAKFGEPASLLTRVGARLHRSSAISALAYRMLRGLRNVLLRLRGIGRIDNLRDPDES